jgi:hypothetical protein
MKRALLLTFALTVLSACADEVPPGIVLGRALVTACPVAAANDAAAREACADALTDMTELRDALTDPVLWGGQPDGFHAADLLTDASLTQFDPRVWRRMYLSTFMFEAAPSEMEQDGKYQVLRMRVQFRNKLDAGDYPYPFWHSGKKWTAYEQATEVLFVFDSAGRIPVAVRTTPDPTHEHDPRTWDGVWTWNAGQEPHVSLYTYLFSPGNPHVAALDTAYRSLEETMREQDCSKCHSPSNSAMALHLELLNYPNQALTARHKIAHLIQINAMPPVTGIPSDDTRADLIQRAMTFANAGDAALAYEGEPVPSL